MTCNRLTAILVREQRAYIADHIAFGVVLTILGSVIAGLTAW